MADDIVMVTNRTKEDFETMYEGATIIIPAGKTIPMRIEKARNIVPNSYQRIQLTTGIASHFRLGIQGETDCSPIALEERAEVLDRMGSEKLQHSKPQVLDKEGLEPIPISDVGASPVSTPVTSAIVREAAGKKKGKKGKKLTAKTLEFENPPDMRRGGSTGSVISKTA